MGWKQTLSGAADKVTHSLSQNRDKFEQGIDKAADLASRKTGGKYDVRIRKGAEQARSGLDKVAASDEPGHSATGSDPSSTAEPTSPPPAPPSGRSDDPPPATPSSPV
jgi:hypothetical protein